MKYWFAAFFLTALSTVIPQFTFAQTDDDDVISVDSTIVVMNVAVTDARGLAVEGLRQRNFRIFENGVEQLIEIFSPEETPFAAVILLDTSGSMEDRVSLARSAAIQFLNGMRRTDVAAIFKFDSKVEMVRDFSGEADLNERFFGLRSGGMTVLNDAVLTAAEALSKRPEKRRAIIVLSDGADTQSRASMDKAMRAALAVDANIYTVDMSPVNAPPQHKASGVRALKSFAERTGGTFIAAPGGVDLRNAFRRIVEELGNVYTLAYSPKNTTRDGKWRPIEVRVDKPGLTIRTRKGYHAPRAGK